MAFDGRFYEQFLIAIKIASDLSGLRGRILSVFAFKAIRIQLCFSFVAAESGIDFNSLTLV